MTNSPAPAPAEQLYQAIMNLPCRSPPHLDNRYLAYEQGHLDALRAAAELVTSQPAERLREPIEPYADDIAISGPDAPSCDQIEGLIRLLLTIHKRFGNTAIRYRVQWGGSALWAEDDQKKRIASLESQLAAAEQRVKELENRKCIHDLATEYLNSFTPPQEKTP